MPQSRLIASLRQIIIAHSIKAGLPYGYQLSQEGGKSLPIMHRASGDTRGRNKLTAPSGVRLSSAISVIGASDLLSLKAPFRLPSSFSFGFFRHHWENSKWMSVVFYFYISFIFQLFITVVFYRVIFHCSLAEKYMHTPWVSDLARLLHWIWSFTWTFGSDHRDLRYKKVIY